MDKSEYIKFQQNRDFGQILATTFRYIRQNLKSLFMTIYAIGLPLLIVSSFLMGTFYYNLIQDNTPDIFTIISAVTGYVLLTLAFLAVYAAIIEHTRLYAIEKERDITVAMVWQGVWSRLGSYIGISFVIFFMVLAAPLLGLIMFAFGLDGAVIVLFVLIEFALYLFAIYLGVKSIFAYIPLSHEKRGVVDSIKRSWWATQDKWWFTFGLGFVANMIQTGISYIIFIPIYVIFIMVMIFGAADGGDPFSGESSWMGYLMSLVMFIYLALTLFTYCIPAVALTLQFHSVVEDLEGEGLADRIQAFDAPEVEVDPESLL